MTILGLFYKAADTKSAETAASNQFVDGYIEALNVTNTYIKFCFIRVDLVECTWVKTTAVWRVGSESIRARVAKMLILEILEFVVFVYRVIFLLGSNALIFEIFPSEIFILIELLPLIS